MPRTNSIPLPHLVSRVLMFAALVLVAPPARALVVPPWFSGYTKIDRFTQEIDYQATVPFPYYRDVTRLDIDVAHGLVDDGGISSSAPIGYWGYDYDAWAPLVGKYDIQAGGYVTYGSPAPNVFAVTWVDMPSRNDTGVRNTFQIVFFGDSTFHTNNGISIQPGSVVFAYGSPSDAAGTVHYSSLTGAAIGMVEHGNVRTLNSMGVGDALGVLSDLDIPALQNSGDPFLFGGEASGSPDPVAFTSVPGLGGTAAVPPREAPAMALRASPNPASLATTLSYTLPRAGHVTLVLQDIQGRRVTTLVDAEESAGGHSIPWTARAAGGSRVAPGVYLARLETPYGTRLARIVVLD